MYIIPEKKNENIPHHGSMSFDKGIHRCLGEQIVMKSVKELYKFLD